MSCTINFTQLKRKKKNDGTIPVYIRLTENKESVYINTGISVSQTDWNDRKQEVRKSNDKHKVYNDELRNQFLKVEKNKFELKRRGKLKQLQV